MKLVIVGNGAGVLKSEKKEFIDSCDMVVRLNGFRISGYENFVGTKFNIYSCTTTHLHTIDILDDEERLLKSEYLKKYNLKPGITEEAKKKFRDVYLAPKIESSKLDEIWVLSLTDKSPISHYPFIDKIKIRDFELKINFSTGFTTILYCLNRFKGHEIFITGFDCFISSGWYWDMTPWELKHIAVVRPDAKPDGKFEPYVLERIKLNELIQKGSIKKI